MEKILERQMRMWLSVLFIVVLFLVMTALSGCGISNGVKSGVLSWDKLTPKGRAAMALGLYNDEYDNYMMDVKLPDLSEASKALLRKRRKALVALHDAITVYSGYAKIGAVPPDDVEEALLKLISQVPIK